MYIYHIYRVFGKEWVNVSEELPNIKIVGSGKYILVPNCLLKKFQLFNGFSFAHCYNIYIYSLQTVI